MIASSAFAAELVDADKELFDGAEDDRGFRAPAIGIGMLVRLLGDEHAAIAQQPDDIGVGVEDVFADQFGQADFLGVAAEIVDRREDREGRSFCLTNSHLRRGRARCGRRRCRYPS